MKSVKVNIKFPSKTEAQKQLNTALEGLNSSLKINLDTKSFTSSIATMSKELNKLKTQLDKFGVIEHIIKTDDVVKAKKEFEDLGKIAANSLNIGNGSKGFSELQARANEIKNTVSELSKINYNLDADGNLKKAVITYKDNVGNVVTETMEWRKLLDEINKQYINVFETTNISVGDNVEKINKANEAMEKLKANMQSKLNIASDNNLISPSVIADLQTKLDSINTDTPEREINELKTAITNLSKTDSGIVRLQNAISSMESNIASAKSKYGTLIKSEDIAKPIEEVNKLKTALNDLQNGKSIDGNKISSMINAGNTSIRQMTTEAKNASSALKLTQKDAMSIGDAIKTSLQKFGIFTSAAMATRQLITAIKEGITYIKYLNDAYTDLSITMDVTLGQFTDMTTQVHSIAKAMGANAENVMDIVKVYANASTTIDEVMQKIAPSVALSNVARMDGGEVTKTIQATLNVFKMLEDGSQDVEAATERIGNVLVSVSRNMKYDFADGTRQLVSAIQDAGSVAEVSGVSLERYAAMVGAVVEATGKQGTEVATSFKFIAARILQIKELSEETDTTVEDMGKAEKALQKFGITIREGNGQLKSLDTILEEVAGQWSTMKDEEKQYLSEAAAGNRQRAAFINIMETMTKQQELYNTAMNSEGALMAANEKYVESFSGKVQTLQASFQSLASTTLNSNFIMGFIDALSTGIGVVESITKTFGALPTAITTVVGAMTLLNSKFRENANVQMSLMIPCYDKLMNTFKSTERALSTKRAAMIDEVNSLKEAGSSTDGFNVKLLKLQAGLGVTTAKLIATKVAAIALQTVISMGLSLAITAIIGAVSKLADILITTDSELKELNSEFANLATNSTESKLNSLLNKYKKLEENISTLSKGTKEYLDAEAELAKIQEQIVALYPKASDAIYDNGNAKRLNLEQTEKLAEAELNILKAKAQKSLGDNEIVDTDDIKKAIQEYEVYNKVLEESRKLKGEGSTTVDVGDYNSSGKLTVGGSNRDLRIYTERLEESKTKLEALYEASKLLEDENEELSGSTYLLEKALGKLNDEMGYIGTTDASGVLDGIAEAADGAAMSVDELTKSFSDLDKPIELLRTMIDEFSQFGMISTDTWKNVISSGNSELIALLGDNNNFLSNAQELLDKNISKQEDYAQSIIKSAMESTSASSEIVSAINSETDALIAREEAQIDSTSNSASVRMKQESDVVNANSKNYAIDAENKAESETYKMKGSFASATERMKAEADAVTNNGKNYDVDSKNYNNVEISKAKNADSFVNSVMLGVSDMVNNNSLNYGKDAGNFVNSINTKLEALRKLNLANGVFTKASDILNPSKDVVDIIKQNTNAYVDFGNAVNNYTSTVGTYNPVSHSGSIGGSSSSGSGSSGSSSTSKNVADLEDLTDRYYNVNNAITQVENSLKALQTAMENSTEEEKMKLLQKEITLLYDKKKALEALQKEQQKEAAELKKQLSSNGFKFDKNGNVTNAIERLTQLTNQANKLTGDSKEAAIAKVKNLNETLKQYTDLLLDKIPDVADEINNMKNEVISAQKEIASILEEQRDKYIDGLEKETDKLKTELEKRKQLMQQSWEEEDYKDELNKKQKALNDLEDQLALAMRTADEELIKSIRLQIQEAQDEINNFIRDNERENASNRFDEEMDKADEDLQNKIDEITSKLSEEEILKLVQQGVTDLSNILNKISSNTNNVRTAFTSVGAVIEDTWIKSLDAFISKLNTIETLNPTVSFAANGMGVRAASNITVNSGDIIIQGSADELTLGKIEKMLDENNRELIKEIDACFER